MYHYTILIVYRHHHCAWKPVSPPIQQNKKKSMKIKGEKKTPDAIETRSFVLQHRTVNPNRVSSETVLLKMVDLSCVDIM